MSLPKIPPPLVNDLAAGNCVVFVGAGLSQAAGLPCWADLLTRMISWSGENGVDLQNESELLQLIREDKLLLVAEEIKERMGREQFRRVITETFGNSSLTPTDTHLLLTSLPFHAAITTNYDRLIESAYSKRSSLPQVFTHQNTASLMSSLRDQSFYVLKAHGTVDQIETVILGRSDYRELMYGNRAYHDHLKVIFSTKTVLFIGYSLTDPDLQMLLDDESVVSRGYKGAHYALMNLRKISEVERKRFDSDYGISILPYEASNDYHPEVREFLSELSSRVQARQQSLQAPDLATPIDPDNVARIFEPLQTGLGLSIAQSIIAKSEETQTGDSTESHAPEVATEEQEANPARSQLDEAFTAADKAMSANWDSSDNSPPPLEAFAALRLRLLVAEWVSPHLISSFLDTHEINLLYLSREQLKATASELHLLLRMLINDSSGFVPGWYWLSKFDSSVVERVLQSAGLSDSYDRIQLRVFELLRFGSVPLPDDVKRRAYIQEVALTASTADNRRAGIAYLGAVAVKSEMKTIGSALVDDDSSVRREALISKYRVLSRVDPDRALKEMLSESSIEPKNIVPLLQEYSSQISKEILTEALGNASKELRLFAAQALRDNKQLTAQIATSLTNDESKKIKALGYEYLIEEGENVDALAIYQGLPNEKYTRQFSRRALAYESDYIDPEDLVLRLCRRYSAEQLRDLLEWKNPVGHVAYAALGQYQFSTFEEQIRKDLEEDFAFWKGDYQESRQKEWNEMDKWLRRALLETKPSGWGRLFSHQLQETEEEIERKIKPKIAQEIEERKINYLAAALGALVEHGQDSDAVFGRNFLSHEDYDVRVEAVRLITKFGRTDDAKALIGVARSSEGILQELAANGALSVSTLAPEIATELIRTSNEVLSGIVIARFADQEDAGGAATFLEEFLYNDSDKTRRQVLAFFSQTASDQEIEELLTRYTQPARYFYDVVCWLDRLLYAPKRLQDAYRNQLAAEIKASVAGNN